MAKINWTKLIVTSAVVLLLLYLFNLLVSMVLPAYTPFAFDFSQPAKLVMTVILLVFSLAGRQYIQDSFNI